MNRTSRNVVAALAALTALVASGDRAEAQSRASSANPFAGSTSRSPAGVPPAVAACNRSCMQQVTSCATAAARARNQAAALAQCRQTGVACLTACSSQGGAPDVATPPPIDNPGATGAPEQPPFDDSGVVQDLQGELDQLIASWQAQDNQRVAYAERRAAASVAQFLQMLCGASGQTTCTVGAAGRPSLPNAAIFGRRASDRWAKPAPQPQAPPPKAPPPWAFKGKKPPPKSSGTNALSATNTRSPSGPKGCYVERPYHVRGAWPGNRQMYYDTPITAEFDQGGSGPTLTVKNNGDKDAWIGRPTPINDVVPAHGQVQLPFVQYRQSGDNRANEGDIAVKFWSDDENACAAGAVNPGFTTPEEWGPTTAPAPESIE